MLLLSHTGLEYILHAQSTSHACEAISDHASHLAHSGHPSGTNRQHECLGVGALWDAAVPQLLARARREARLGTALAMFVCLVSVAKSLRHQGNSSEKNV